MTKKVYDCGTIGPPGALTTSHIESFMTRQRDLGYADCKFRDKYRIVKHFVTATKMMECPVSEITEVHLFEYLKAFDHISKERLRFKRSLLLSFFRHLRHMGIISNSEESVDHSPNIEIEKQYADYLRVERGLSIRTLMVYLPPMRKFLAEFAETSREDILCDLNAEMIRAYLLGQLDSRAGESARLLIVAFRSFLRFLFLRGVTQLDLSSAVTPMRKARGAEIHAFLSSAEVERVLSVPDLETPVGQRDHGILILLARLGLRAGEVVTLELDDICWRTGEIVVHGKGRERNCLPLLKDVGTAIALYIESGRGSSDCRKVFLRRFAPRVGFSGPAAVGHIVRKYLDLAGVQRPPQVAAHLFRHTLATEMLHNGASLTEISEVLRHRSLTTTEIYAKVAFDSLREVARPWPGEEVVR